MNEFSSLLESYITKTGSLVIAGDFNFHVDDTTDTAAANFLSLLESFDLQQHVRSCTSRPMAISSGQKMLKFAFSNILRGQILTFLAN